MNRKIILFPLAMAAILGLASCTSENPQPSNSEPETSQVPSSNEEAKKATITPNKTAIELTVGDTERITVTVENAENKNVSFASSDVTIATVDAAAGVVTAVKEGTTKIIVTLDADQTVKAEVAVTVKAPELIKLSSVTKPVSEKNTYYGVITTKTSNGFVIDDGTGALYVCKTTNYNVGDYVSVTDSITAYFGLLETSFSPTIAKMEGTAPTLREATPLTKEIIDTVQAQVTDAKQSGGTTGFHLADMGPYSFKLPAVIDGSYTNFMLGDYKLSPMKYSGDRFQNGVTYTVKGYFAGWNSKGSYYQFIVSSVEGEYAPVESISVTAANDAKTLTVGTALKLTATVLPATADPNVIWSVDNEEIATIGQSGSLTAIAAGTVTATATSKADSTKKASITITITAKAAVDTESIVFNWNGIDGGYAPDTGYTTKQATWTNDNGDTVVLDKNNSITDVSTNCWANKFALRVYKGAKLTITVSKKIDSVSIVTDTTNGAFDTNATVGDGYNIVKVDDQHFTVNSSADSNIFSFVAANAQVRVQSITLNVVK